MVETKGHRGPQQPSCTWVKASAQEACPRPGLRASFRKRGGTCHLDHLGATTIKT